MTMGDRIKPGAKWTLGNAIHATDKATANKDAPTGGQTAPVETARKNGNPEPTLAGDNSATATS